MRALRAFGLLAVAVGAGGCPTVTVPNSHCGPSGCVCDPVVERLVEPTNKVDLLLVLDDARTGVYAEAMVAQAIPELIGGIVNPPCLSPGGQIAAQPNGPLDACPAGSQRASTPVLDLHVGVLSSSLGSYGADGCTATQNDHGHLVTRPPPGGTNPVPTYQNEGFVAWDPAQKQTPPGEASQDNLSKTVQALVLGVGNAGCPYRAQNESWYRFLVDPSPYQSIALVNDQVVTSGIDDALLQQRRAFLRPDSTLAIVVVTDHDDASIKEYSSYPLLASMTNIPAATSACTTKGPSDPCCASCAQPTPPGCPPSNQDPSCQGTAWMEGYPLKNLGLITEKTQYGIEFFYQPSRYVDALTKPTVTDADGKTVPNPIFTNLDPSHPGIVRDPSMVVYATITGVPWQIIARQANGKPDLIHGVSVLDPTRVGGFKTGEELSEPDAPGSVSTFWDDAAGDPEHYVAARSPFMVEASAPRTGSDPATGIATMPPTTPNGAGNAINDHERDIPTSPDPPDDIQYACIFDLPAPKDCSTTNDMSCDCGGPIFDKTNPICQPNPSDNGNPSLQTKARAYPAPKNLAIAKGMGAQGVVASVCAAQVADPTAADYGYRPAVHAILDQLHLGPACLPRALTTNGTGQVSCTLFEARDTGGHCDCGVPGRSPVPASQQILVTTAQQDPLASTGHWDCFCEIPQATGSALTSCQNDIDPQGDGWCYVDAASTPPVGNPSLVATCPSTERRRLRYTGAAAPTTGATVFVSCGNDGCLVP